MMREWAMYYSKNGWPVFPVWEPRATSCSCRDGEGCSRPAKHPSCQGWNKRPMSGLDIDLTWTDNPHRNIGVHCKDLLVIDIDGELGVESFRRLKRKYCGFPDTPVAQTGGGGYHVFFKGVDRARNKVSLVDHVDIRAENGYIILPPSRSLKGEYKWVDGREPWSVPLPVAPPWLAAMVTPRTKARPTAAKREPWSVDASTVAPIGDGGRNNGLARLCGSVIRARTGAGSLTVADVLPSVTDDMLAFNLSKCKPPLPAKEVLGIIESIAAIQARGEVRTLCVSG